jgi:hypothetical protein
MGKLTPYGLSSMTVSEREALISNVADDIQREEGSVFNHGRGGGIGGGGSGSPDLWKVVRSDVERAVDEKLGTAVLAEIMSKSSSSSTAVVNDSIVESQIHLALTESERGAISILSKWPDVTKKALKGCLNVALPKELRRAAWKACLRETGGELLRDFYQYMATDRYDKMSAMVGTTLYDT